MPVTVQGPDNQMYSFPDRTDKNAATDYFKKKNIGAPSDTDLAAHWASFDSQRRDRLLKKMTPEQKTKLRSALERSRGVSAAAPDVPTGDWFVRNAPAQSDWFARNAPGSEAAPGSTPTTSVYSRLRDGFMAATERAIPGPDTRTDEQVVHEAGLRPGYSPRDLEVARSMTVPYANPGVELLKGAARGAAMLIRHPIDALKGAAQTAFDVANAPLPLPGLMDMKTGRAANPSQQASLDRLGQQAHEAKQQFMEDPAYLAGQLAGPAIVTEGLGKVAKLPVKTAGELRRMVAERYSPRVVPISGEPVPVLVGEAAPETPAGRTQVSLKKSGIGGAKFDQVARAQQEAVKRVIRSVAQRTTGMVGPVVAEPGAAMQDAADATFAQARPMYRALDESLIQIPESLRNVSRVTASAIQRARALGAEVNIAPEGGSVVINGRQFSPGTDPVGWENLKAQGLTPDAATGQPLATYAKVRSELLKMQRTASDAALRYKIGNEVRAMNESVEDALKDTPLHENWVEANRLWSKGYALRDVADAIAKSTKGTPAAEQAPGISPVQTRLQGSQLVRRLNDMHSTGTLARAFSPEEAAHLRQAADILDRVSASAVKSGAITNAHSIRGMAWRTIMKLPSVPLVRVMTTMQGVEALRAVESATTKSAFDNAVTALAVATTASTVSRTAGEAKAQVKALRAQP